VLALIAEDDRNTRMVLTRLLQKLDVESLAAENGLELLALLKEHEPNLIVLDFEMPFLNGFETLQAIRSTDRYQHLPVICVSSHSEAHLVRDMIALGLTDYLVKPINPAQALDRLRPTIEAARHRRTRETAESIQSLMLVDGDPNFRSFAKPLLGEDCEVIEAASGMEAVSLFRERRPPPPVVLVADGLHLMSGDQLVETLQRVASSLGVPAPRVYLLSSDNPVDPERAGHFAGVLKKSFIPTDFLGQLRAVLHQLGPTERLAELLDGDLAPEIITAARQTIGVLAGQDVGQLDSPADDVAWTYRSTIKLTEASTGAGIEVSLLGDEASTLGIASKMLHVETSIADGAAEVLGELANTVAGRIRASLLIRSIDLEMGLPEQITEEPPASADGWPHAWALTCASGERLLIGCRVFSGPPTASPKAKSASPPDADPASRPEAMATAPAGGPEPTPAPAGSDQPSA
jgi:CheY-like chemotaxis protein